MRNVFMALLMVLGACLALEVPEPITLGKAFTLNPGPGGTYLARLESAGWTLEFVRVQSDGRCPKDVDCYWAGDAVLELRAFVGKQQQRFVLHTGLAPRKLTVLGYQLELKKLEPERERGVALAYRATFVLSKP
jgi:hypothetical protein